MEEIKKPMEEDNNNAHLVSWKNNDHIHIHSSSLEDQSSQIEISRDTNNNMNHTGNVVSPASLLRIKIKGPSPSPSPSPTRAEAADDHNIKNKNEKEESPMEEEDNNNNNNKNGLHHSHGRKGPISYLCNICNITFISPYDLSIHTRNMHYLSKNKDRKKGTRIAKTNNKNNKTYDSENSSKPTCYLCRKKFPSMKSLSGHMRIHSQRRASNPQPQLQSQGEGIQSSHMDITTANAKDSDVRLSRSFLVSWPLSCKRSRRFKKNSYLKHRFQVDPLMERAAASALLLLAEGNFERQVDLSPPISATENFRFKENSYLKHGFQVDPLMEKAAASALLLLAEGNHEHQVDLSPPISAIEKLKIKEKSLTRKRRIRPIQEKLDKEEEAVVAPAKKKTKKKIVSATVQELPIEFKNRIEELNGSDTRFLMSKKLYEADVMPNNSRLSMPEKQINCDFLTEAEKESTAKEAMEVTVLDPCLREFSLDLKKWKMNTIFTYNLKKNWNRVVLDNKFEEDHELQIWSFRVNAKLYIVLNKV